MGKYNLCVMRLRLRRAAQVAANTCLSQVKKVENSDRKSPVLAADTAGLGSTIARLKGFMPCVECASDLIRYIASI